MKSFRFPLAAPLGLLALGAPCSVATPAVFKRDLSPLPGVKVTL